MDNADMRTVGERLLVTVEPSERVLRYTYDDGLAVQAIVQMPAQSRSVRTIKVYETIHNNDGRVSFHLVQEGQDGRQLALEESACFVWRDIRMDVNDRLSGIG